MRVQPPKTKKKYIPIEEFEKYILNHKVIGDGFEMPVDEFFLEVVLKQHKNIDEAVCAFSTMWPEEYQQAVEAIFLKVYLEKNVFEKNEPID